MLFCRKCTFLDKEKHNCKLFNNPVMKSKIHGKVKFVKDSECLHKNDFFDNDLFDLLFSGKKTFIQIKGWK